MFEFRNGNFAFTFFSAIDISPIQSKISIQIKIENVFILALFLVYSSNISITFIGMHLLFIIIKESFKRDRSSFHCLSYRKIIEILPERKM